MRSARLRLWRLALCAALAVAALAATARGDEEVPSESQCRPYIEKALKHLESGDVDDSKEKNDSSEVSIDEDNTNEANSAEDDGGGTEVDSKEDDDDDAPSLEVADEPYVAHTSVEELDTPNTKEESDDSNEKDDDDSKEEDKDDNDDSKEQEKDDDDDSKEKSAGEDDDDDDDSKEKDDGDSKEEASTEGQAAETESDEDKGDGDDDDDNDDQDSKEVDDDDDSKEAETDADDGAKDASAEQDDDDTKEDDASVEGKDGDDDDDGDDDKKSQETDGDDDGSQEEAADTDDDDSEKDGKSKEDDDKDSTEETAEAADDDDTDTSKEGDDEAAASDDGEDGDSDDDGAPVEELLKTGDVPDNLRSRDHIETILRLNEDASEADRTVEGAADIVLRDLKRLYDNNIKPLETVYKYRDLSNRHFGDPEIFSKPLVLFMGPWSGGKSSIVNYLTGLEFTDWSLRTGAEPSPAYFNILQHGAAPAVLDGTQLAADWTFAGLQKFGQGLEERLRGLKYPSKLLEKVNIVEIPGILEVRKQVSRVFPFNDACQWFIDRADIIFLVYDPSKLDVGPETEAILDQLKGREAQTRIVLNKADSVKPEELMRVQSALIWNISPLMSSAQPPVMYTVSLWSMPYDAAAPERLLRAQEHELLRDLRTAIDRRIENKMASARRFAVRVRNHAKMVDCYLTTFYNHKTIFGNKKVIADAIIENPQNYHIYEGLSTLTNISRYDLPDPETYRDFFRLNPLFEFQQLSATCTYFRGCPITKLDVAIAYDLPELVGKYKKMVETATPQGMPKS